MSDAVASPAAAPAVTESAPTDAKAAPGEAKDASAAPASPPPTPAEKRRYKVKIEGQEEDVDEDALIANFQKNRAADKRLQEVSEERRRAREAKELGKKDPIRALREFFEVENPDAVIESYLAEKYKAELLKEKDPNAYALSEKEKAIAEREARIQQYEAQQAQQIETQRYNQQAAHVRDTFGKALEVVGVSEAERPEAIAAMVDAALAALDYGVELTPEQLASEAKAKLEAPVVKGSERWLKELDSAADDEAFLAKLSPARVERVRKALLAKARALQAKPPPPQDDKSGDAGKPAARQYESDSVMMRRMMRGG